MDETTIMIVDDEKLAIEDLISIFNWEANGFKIVATAVNGKQALKKFAEIEPQIVITDIKMPFMDGIELIRNIRELNSKTKILLLTAYSDFGYAKHAIQYGITDYMIKSEINSETLKDRLFRLKNTIDTETKASFMLMQKMISDFFNSSVQNTLEEFLLDKELFHTPYCYIIIEEDLPIPVSEENFEYNDKHYENEIISCCMSIKEEKTFIVTACSIRSSQILLIVKNEEDFSQQAIRSKMMQFANKVKQTLIDCFNTSFTMYVINYRMNLFEMKRSYMTHNKRLFAKYMLGSGIILDFLDKKLDWIEKEVSFDDRLMIDSIEEMDNCQLQKQIDCIFAQVLPPNSNYTGMKLICRNLFTILRKNTDELPKSARKPDLTLCNHYGQDIKKWFKCRFEELINEKRKVYENNYSKVITRAIDYMYENYKNTDFTINDVADHVNLSAGRLSVLFKKETGKTVNDFLTDIRITKAKKLLEQGVYKVYEVSSMVGYGSSQYFSQIFYKLTGFYPNKFRKGTTKK